MALLVIRFMFGVGEAGSSPCSTGVISRWFEKHEVGKAQGYVWAASRMGGALTPFVVIPIMAWLGWRAAFWLLGALGIIWADKSQARAWGDGVVEVTSQRLYTVMPVVLFVALDKRHIKIYGKVAAGGQLSIGTFEPMKIRPAFQLVPIGLQWGGEKVFALAELGFCNVYTGRIGVGIRW